MSIMNDRALRLNDDAALRGLLSRVAGQLDRAAFAELFDAFAPKVKSFMMRKGAAPELAEDLVQETMIAVWTKAGLYDPARGAVSTWIFTIARNQWIDRHRRDGLMPLAVLDGYDPPSGEAGSDEVMGRKQEAALIAQALDEIPPEQKEPLMLSFVEDMAHGEIARKLNLPLGTVKSRVRLAYGRLRKSLEALQ
jgi:RNA polymerase sigma-70 factor, ECF subfamily